MRLRGAGVLLGLVACAPGGEQTAAEPCRIVQQPVALPAEVRESSGVAASRRYPDVVWTHNDSGGNPEVLAVDVQGGLRGRVQVTGTENKDWEDIALGPCPSGECLYIADIGDNQARRNDLEIYRIPEPTPNAARTDQAERFRVRYPDGPRDAEALFVLPSGELFIISKDPVPVLYRYPAPFRADETVTLERVRELALPDRVTAADATADGDWVAVRTNSSLALYRTEDLLQGTGAGPIQVSLSPVGEPQGEGISFGAEGRVVLSSEGGTRRTPGLISTLSCQLPAADGPSPSRTAPP